MEKLTIHTKPLNSAEGEVINADNLDSQFWLNIEDRRNIWYFNYFVAKNLHGFLSNFVKIADFSKVNENILKIQPPSECVDVSKGLSIIASLRSVIISFERHRSLDFRPNLHELMNLLPYLNDRHYSLSRYKYENYSGEVWCSFEDMKNLDRTIARRIAPVLRDFSICSQFPAGYFSRMYTYPGDRFKSSNEEWRKALALMADSWEWLATRESKMSNEVWEVVPDEIYYGLHLFAEYVWEMNNN